MERALERPKMSTAKVTIHDVAREAGVSLATVDRVLNGRPGVRAKTVDKVAEAVRKLGYVRNAAAAALARTKDYRLHFLMPDSDNLFMRRLREEISVASEVTPTLPATVTIDTYPSFDPAALSDRLAALGTRQIDGVALVATDAPEVRSAVNNLIDQGIELITLVSDLPSSRRSLFVGIDNLAAGRAAGALMTRFVGKQGGRVALLTGSLRVRDHAERRLGFEQAVGDAGNAFTIARTMESFDDPARAETLIGDLLRDEPDLVGIYSAAGGNRGLIKTLRQAGRAESVTIIAHELTEATRTALQDGTIDAVIHQDPGHEARSAVRLLLGKVSGERINWRQEAIRIEIFIKENMT